MYTPGVNVRITIFCDFRQFLAKNWRFSQKPILWSKFCIIWLCFESKRQFFLWIFRRKYFKIIPSVPEWSDWTNFRLCIRRFYTLDCFFKKHRTGPNFWATFSHCKSGVLILTKKWIGSRFGRFPHKLIWSPWSVHIAACPKNSWTLLMQSLADNIILLLLFSTN
jgi:hypothetical protein